MSFSGARYEWLHECSKVHMLPRYDERIDNVSFYIKDCSLDDVSKRLVWVVTTLDGPWRLTKSHFYLKENTDIVHYCLRWGDFCEKSS
jgi:hypothetical protein